jgi:hypothetical protein
MLLYSDRYVLLDCPARPANPAIAAWHITLFMLIIRIVALTSGQWARSRSPSPSSLYDVSGAVPAPAPASIPRAPSTLPPPRGGWHETMKRPPFY